MARDNVSESEKILVKVDQNNLIYIDPNSTIEKDGTISPRGIKQENLVIYVNLEADIIPRSILVAENDKNTLTSIAKGKLNFLKNQTGEAFDTTWTDSYLENKEVTTELKINGEEKKVGTGEFYQSDESGQSFGIESINIITRGINAIPEVTINFIDVRGKTLFESPENSPYNAFFHVPWPIFYLTVKGFYGKAIRYRLHLVKFSSRFNESTGNFESVTKFVGSTFAYLSDIPLKGILNAPYMFMVETTKTQKTDGEQSTKIISRSSKGYATLKGVYDEYKEKGLIPQDFPVRTLRELVMTAQNLDKIWESQILGQRLNPQLFVGLKDFDENLSRLETQIQGWRSVNLSNEYIDYNGINYYYIIKKENKENYEFNLLFNDNKESTLEWILTIRMNEIKTSKLFTDTILKDKTMDIDFTRKTLLSKQLRPFKSYIRKKDDDGRYLVAIELLLNDIYEIRKIFDAQRDKLELAVEAKMNDVLKNKTNKDSFGFEPTIRNVFAVILANADTYIRLLKDVHTRAFQQAEKRKKLIKGLTDETKDEEAIYPWPEIKKPVSKGKTNVIAYPGEKELTSKLQSYDTILWPEVDFVENFIAISTNREDTNTDKETGVGNINFKFESDDIDRTKILNISTLFTVANSTPYITQVPSSFIYEIYERAVQATLIDTFDYQSLYELAMQEFQNVKEATKENNDLVELLKLSGTTIANFLDLVYKISPYERYPYYQDFIPTNVYLKNLFEVSHKIEKYKRSAGTTTPTGFDNTAKNLLTYRPEDYRLNIYPYTSQTYLSYINKSKYDFDNFEFNEAFKVETSEGFISSINNITDWVKKPYRENLFSQKLIIDDMEINILNTPYFHNQLYSDYNKVGATGKYAGSAYLLLNSLPFHDLEDTIKFTNTNKTFRASSLFREIGASHYLPYHLILKWGSIYHRYKKYLLESVDILDGCLDGSNVTKIITGSTFFNNNQTGNTFTDFTASGQTITYTGNTDVGTHPYYDAIFHEIVNDFPHYDVSTGNASYSGLVINNAIRVNYRENSNKLKYWTNFVDVSKFAGYTGDTRYTLLPCDGYNKNIDKTLSIPNAITRTNIININIDTFDSALQNNFRIIWEDDYINSEFSGQTFPSYNQYHRSYVSGETKTYDNLYSIDSDYRKIIDLMGTFSPNILEDFENMFLEFATERINDDSLTTQYDKANYNKFQDLLKDIVSITKNSNDDSNIEILLTTIKSKQVVKLREITTKMLSDDNIVKLTIGNPKEINSHVFYGFSEMDNLNTFSYNEFDVSQITTQTSNFIKLYIGEDIDGYYEDFFEFMNVELSEENVIQFRPLILIYAGYRKAGNTNTDAAFKTYLRNNIFIKNGSGLLVGGFIDRLRTFLTYLTKNFSKLEVNVVRGIVKKFSGYNDDPLKIELYNTFKSFNDKWIAGNSIGQRLLLEEFLFLDKANKDIGDKAYLNLDRLIDLTNTKNDKGNLYTTISMIIQGTGFDLRPLPSYVNFYGTNYNNKNKIMPSEKVAQNIFGTYLDVDYQESSPKVIVQFTGPSSKRPADTGKSNKFKDDSYFIGSTQKNPLIITLPQVFDKAELYKSNRVVAFEVSFGDQNQSIFKGVQLDQSSIKNTSESFVVLENLARSESGAGAYNVDIGLYDYYKQASYTCEVTMMGNVMIQPTMFFYLKNIPMFRGSYWITEVYHDIKPNNIVTRFKGTRIPIASLPDPSDTFLSSYRVLFDRLMNKTIQKINNQDSEKTTTELIIKDQDGNVYSTNPGAELENENINNVIVKRVGITAFGVPYNGALDEQYIQMINYNGSEWLRTRVVKIGGVNYPISDDTEFGLVSKLKNTTKLKWSEISNTAKTKFFYTTKFKYISSQGITPEKIITGVTKFLNPKEFKKTKQVFTLSYSKTGTAPNRVFTGQIGNGPALPIYGMAMSEALMKRLNLIDGDVVYFKIE